jgi:hypothetical protein
MDVIPNEVIFGRIPQHKRMLVNAWIEIHREELIASWNAGRLIRCDSKLSRYGEVSA